MQVRECILNVKNLKLVGAQDFGLENAETSRNTDKRANHALVFMFSSLSDDFSQPFVVYTAKGSTKGSCLAQLMLQVISKIEKAGAKIHGVVCDGAASNRKMWSLFGISGCYNRTINKIIHPFDDSRNLYFFSDAPHLIMCLRNRVLDKRILKIMINN